MQEKTHARIVSKAVHNKLLSHAFTITKHERFKLNVNSIDGEVLERGSEFWEHDDERINVDVRGAIVKRSWVG